VIAGPTARRRRILERGSTAVVDQLLSSASGLLLIVLVAREAQPSEFGGVSVALIAHGFVLGCLRAVVGEVSTIRLRRDPSRRVPEERLALFLACVSGALAAVVFLVAGAIVPGFTGTFLQIVGVCAIVVHLQDIQRYLCFAGGQMGEAILLDGTWLVVQVGLTVALLSSSSSSPEALIWAWGVGAAVSAALGLLRRRRRPSSSGVRRWVREDGGRALSFLSDFVVSTGMVQAAFLVLSVVLTLGEFGALRLAFVSMSPLANALAGVRVLTLAHYSGLRDQPRRAAGVGRKVALALGAMGVAYGAVVVLMPESWGVEIFGPTWVDAHAFVEIVAIGEVLRLTSFPAIDLLKVFAPPATLVKVRSVVAALVVVGLVAGAVLSGPEAAAVSVAIAYGVATTAWWAKARAATAAAAATRRAAADQQEPVALSSPTPPG
jgi:O-antigen/teichoic acid export membrane protein